MASLLSAFTSQDLNGSHINKLYQSFVSTELATQVRDFPEARWQEADDPGMIKPVATGKIPAELALTEARI